MNTILITGAGRGLGLELARQYAADGWRVIGTVRGASGKGALQKAGGEALEADVTDPASLRALAKRLTGVPLDILFCNAGISGNRGSALGKFDYASWEEVMKVNVLGAAATAEALVDNVALSQRKIMAMMSSRLGSIAETSGHPLPYASSKAALNMVAKAISVTLAPRGVIVVALHPGWVRTDMGGPSAPLDAVESTAGLRKVLGGLTLKDSGSFIAYDGTRMPW